MENSDKALDTGAKRVYDVAPSEMFGDFMKTGWAPTPLEGITQDDVIAYCVKRRAELSAAFAGLRLVLPSGGPKQRSNDCDYQYRPHSAFAYYTGVIFLLKLCNGYFATNFNVCKETEVWICCNLFKYL